VVEHPISARSHVSHMDLVPLFFQFLHCSAHRNHIVVGVRRKDENFLLFSSSLGQAGDLDLLLIVRSVPQRPSSNFLYDLFVTVQVQVLHRP